MEEWQERILVDPAVMGGKPLIKGTRVPVQVILGSLAGGMTAEEVCREYTLSEQDVRAALAYAAEVLAQERVYALPAR